MKPYVQIALFFAVTQLLGIYAGIVLINGLAANPELAQFSVAPKDFIPDSNSPLNALVFLAYILFGAAMIMLASRFYKGMALYQLLELVVVSTASSVVFFAIAFSFSGLGLDLSLAIGAVAGLALGLAKFAKAEAKNAAAIISSSGVGALFGFSLGFIPTSIFVLLLALYDYIAVFKTKHMIAMARELSTRELSFAVTAKNVPAKAAKETVEQYVDRAMKEGERLDLGTGDLSVPAMLAVSAYTLGPNGLIYSLAVATGSTISIYLLLRFVSKQRVFLPALPPICFGGMLALLIVKLFGF